MKLDNVYRSACISIGEGRLIFVNEIKLGDWQFAHDLEDIPEDLLE
jgi:hypothetical protein